MNTTFVTAMYGHGFTSTHGGRGRHIHFYNSSLRNIHNLNIPLVIYTDPERVAVTEQFISPYMKKYRIVPQALEEFEFAKQVLEYKEKTLVDRTLNDRNHILCYNKPYWVKDSIEKNYFNTEKFLWIDSGLTHHGIFPEKVGGVELYTNPLEEVYYPTNTNNIFNPTLGANLDKILQPDKLFGCALPLQGGDDQLKQIIKSSLDVNIPHVSDHVIGGMFGGYSQKFLEFFNIYRTILKYCIEQNILILEEPIFSCVNAVYPDMFNIHKFTTWWFYSPGERTHMLGEEGDSFYKVFKKIHDL